MDEHDENETDTNVGTETNADDYKDTNVLKRMTWSLRFLTLHPPAPGLFITNI